MSTKFTPGPWRRESNSFRDGWIIGADGEACACAGGKTAERLKANADFIVASTDMYEALKAITDCYGVGYKDPAKFVEHVHDFMMEGRAALAKARGGK